MTGPHAMYNIAPTPQVSTPNVHIDVPPNQALNRACESCRISKVRCLPGPSPTVRQCQRCLKQNRPCIFAPPQVRKPRKRTDARVAELEKEVKAMRALLKKFKAPQNGESQAQDDSDREARMSPASETEGRGMRTTGLDTNWGEAGPVNSTSASVSGSPFLTPIESNVTQPIPGFPVPTLDVGQTLDVVDRGIISLDSANELVSTYMSELVQHWPAVVLPPDTNASKLRQAKPVLFLAILTAASLGTDSSLSFALNQERIRMFAEKILIKCERSLEIIQALLVTVAYYYPPDSISQVQFFQYIHMAATMALEIGIGSKPNSRESPTGHDEIDTANSSDVRLLERCRTLLACYLLTAGVALRNRRPNLLPFNNWMGECLYILGKSPSPLDKRFVAWVRFQRINDEAATSCGFDDPSTGISLTELKLQAVVKGFEKRMDEWLKNTPSELIDVSMMLEYYHNSMCLYEFAMDGGNHNAEEYTHARFNLPSFESQPASPTRPIALSFAQVDAVTKYVSCAHNLLDTFLRIESEPLRRLHNFCYAQASFSLMSLLRVSFSLDTSSLGELMAPESLNIDLYLTALAERLQEAMGPRGCRVPLHWLQVVNRWLKPWHEKHKVWRSQRSSSLSQRPTNSLPSHRDGLPSATSSAQLSSLPASADYSPPSEIPRESGQNISAPDRATHQSRHQDLGSTVSNSDFLAPTQVPDNLNFSFLDETGGDLSGWPTDLDIFETESFQWT